MKYMKMLGLLAVAAAALMAFVGTASATVTSPDGTAYSGPLHAHSSNTTLHGGAATIECTVSTVEGEVEHGTTSGAVKVLEFDKCEPDTVTVVSKGSISVSKSAGVTSVFSTGAEVTVVTHRTVFGFPVTAHCIYKTENTKVGTLTEGTEPVLNIGSSAIPRVTTDGACGSTSVWTGSYQITTPHTLKVD